MLTDTSLHRVWSQVQAGECSLVFSLGRNQDSRLSAGEELIAGQVEGGNVLGFVSEWDQSHEFTVNLLLRLLPHQRPPIY